MMKKYTTPQLKISMFDVESVTADGTNLLSQAKKIGTTLLLFFRRLLYFIFEFSFQVNVFINDVVKLVIFKSTVHFTYVPLFDIIRVRIRQVK